VPRRAIALWAPVLLYMAAIFYLSSLPQPTLPAGGDKPWHLIGYMGLAVVVVRAVAGGWRRRVPAHVAGLAIAIAAAYAASDEAHQMYVPGRSAEAADLVADTIGIVIGTAACWAWGLLSSHKAQVTRLKSQGSRSKPEL
jgi:VanZ family protein